MSQTKKFDKIYFVDDGAGDCGHLPAIYPEPKYFLRKHNLGVVANFDGMLLYAETDFLMMLGADNWLRPNTLEELDKAQKQSNADIITYDIEITGETAEKWINTKTIKKYHGAEISKLPDGRIIWDRRGGHHGSMLYRRTMAIDVGGYNRNIGGVNSEEDLVLWNRMIEAGAKVAHVSLPLLMYRRHKRNFNPDPE